MNTHRFASILTIVSASLLTVLVASCSDETPAPLQTTTNPSMVIEPRESVGRIRAGMKVADVIAAYGEPQRRTANALSYPRLGFAVMPGPDEVVQVVMCGDVTGPNGPLVKAFTGRTKQGIGMGSTREQIIAAYGEPSETQQLISRRQVLKYNDLGITFSLERGAVHHMIVRLSAPSEPY